MGLRQMILSSEFCGAEKTPVASKTSSSEQAMATWVIESSPRVAKCWISRMRPNMISKVSPGSCDASRSSRLALTSASVVVPCNCHVGLLVQHQRWDPLKGVRKARHSLQSSGGVCQRIGLPPKGASRDAGLHDGTKGNGGVDWGGSWHERNNVWDGVREHSVLGGGPERTAMVVLVMGHGDKGQGVV